MDNSNKDIDFVTKHYSEGRFKVNAGWRRLGIASAYRWRPVKVASIVAVTMVIGATAAIVYHNYGLGTREAVPADAVSRREVVKPVEEASVVSCHAVMVIDFEDAPLTQVVEKIKEVYGVSVVGMTPAAESCKLSLHYEGTADDLIETINEILGTELAIEEQ